MYFLLLTYFRLPRCFLRPRYSLLLTYFRLLTCFLHPRYSLLLTYFRLLRCFLHLTYCSDIRKHCRDLPCAAHESVCRQHRYANALSLTGCRQRLPQTHAGCESDLPQSAHPALPSCSPDRTYSQCCTHCLPDSPLTSSSSPRYVCRSH